MLLYKYRVYCVTEASYVYTNWIESDKPAPTTCPNNTAHTIDTNATTIIEVLDTSIQEVKIKEPVDQEGIPTVVSAPYSPSRQYHQIGNGDNLYIAVPDAVNIFDMQITSSMVDANGYCQLFGGEYWTDGNVLDGDYGEFSVVDKDDVLGLFSQYGLVVGQDVLELSKYVNKRPFLPNTHGEIRPNQATKLVQGLYLRSIYVAVAGGVNRKLRVCYDLAK